MAPTLARARERRRAKSLQSLGLTAVIIFDSVVLLDSRTGATVQLHGMAPALCGWKRAMLIIAHVLLALAASPAAHDPGVPAVDGGRVRVIPSVSVGRLRWAGERWRSQVIRIEGTFEPTLYATLAVALPDSLLSRREREQMAWELADIFRWEADFTRDLRPGEPYAILFERLVGLDGDVRFGRMLAAELEVRGHELDAYEFDGSDGRTSYYDANGISTHRSFLRVPVEFKRISDGFSAARFHPILKLWRKHEGIDYAAAPGSPVMSVGDGVILRAGWFGGYGKLVEIQHTNGVVTRYGHLKGFAQGIRPGVKVTQGQCVGFVGSTGLATGPHLHFEFRLNGSAADPRVVLAEEAGQPIAAEEQADFDREVTFLQSQLHAVQPQMVAARP
ncbi:MAG: peptidoglycan DD-metalloendopeptidase family protein [Gemmatimonadales bacterium]